MSSELHDRALRRAEGLEDALRLAVEAGLFRVGNLKDLPKRLFSELSEAQRDIAKGRLVEALERINLAERQIKVAEHERGYWWRLVALHQAHLFLYHVVVLFAVLYGLFCAPGLALELENARLWTVPVSVLVFGALGGVLRGLYWLYQKVQTRTFRPQFTMPQLAAPWIGLLFGALVYLLILGGVMTFGAGASASSGGGGESGAGPVQLAAAFLAGYSWEWVLKWMDSVMSNSGWDSQVDAGNGEQGAEGEPDVDNAAHSSTRDDSTSNGTSS